MRAQCDPARGVNTMELFTTLRREIERTVALPDGYAMRVFGEQESRQESNAALARYLPLTLVLSWYEQKAVCILLPLLALGIKRIYLGPTLPAFLSETVVKTLVDTYQLQPITHPQQDLAAILHRG